MYSKSVVFLSEITDNDRDKGDEHLGRRGVPTEGLDTELESEIIDCQIDGHDEDITRELMPAVESRSSEGDVFLQPETG